MSEIARASAIAMVIGQTLIEKGILSREEIARLREIAGSVVDDLTNLPDEETTKVHAIIDIIGAPEDR